jgi:hypothetical protein
MTDTPETKAFKTRIRGIDGDKHWVPALFAERLERERDEAREELHKASVEANALATSIQKAEYSDAKEFELLGSVAGVISQIDNMYAGVRQQRDEARDTVEQLTKHGLDLMDANRMLKRELKRLKENTK